ncbi:MAG: dienelactone hydrolase family protein [Planctomycetes bacterium]|nr:dienelactone hydrolase family protein [Planctomycetota bacterium]
MGCAGLTGADVETQEVSYRAGDLELKGFLAWDASRSGKRPGILVVHEWWGHNEYARSRARQLAALGYTALAVDMYGGGKQADHPSDAGAFASEVMSNFGVARERFEAGMAVLRAHETTDPDKIAAIGYCFGGSVVLNMARAGVDLDAVASFHGSLRTESKAAPGAVKGRVLVCTGADDPMVPPPDVEAFEQEMRDAGAKAEVIVFPGVVHAFTNPGATKLGEEFGLPLRYDADADRESWEALEDLLGDVF